MPEEKSVERFIPTSNGLVPHQTGTVVKHSDHARLQARLEEVEGELGELVERVERDLHEPDKMLCDVASAKRLLHHAAAMDAAPEGGDGRG